MLKKLLKALTNAPVAVALAFLLVGVPSAPGSLLLSPPAWADESDDDDEHDDVEEVVVTEEREDRSNHRAGGGGTGQQTQQLLGSANYDYYGSVQCPMSAQSADTAGPGCSCPEGMKKRTGERGAAWCERPVEPFQASSPFECTRGHPRTHYASARWVGPGKRDYVYTCIPLGPKPTCMTGCEPRIAFNRGWYCETQTQCSVINTYMNYVVPVGCAAAVGAIAGVACAAIGGGLATAVVCGSGANVVAEIMDVCPEFGGG